MFRYHQANGQESLADVAQRYGVRLATLERQPANQGIDIGDDALIAAGMVVHVPPNCRDLLSQRVRLISEVHNQVLTHFAELEVELETHLEAELAPLCVAEDWVAACDRALIALDENVANALQRLHQQAMGIGALNDTLYWTDVGLDGDLDRYLGGTREYVGLNWLVTPTVLDQWFGLWQVERWQHCLGPLTPFALGSEVQALSPQDQFRKDSRMRLNVVRSV